MCVCVSGSVIGASDTHAAWVWQVDLKIGVGGEAIRAVAAVLRGWGHHADFARSGVSANWSAEKGAKAVGCARGKSLGSPPVAECSLCTS